MENKTYRLLPMAAEHLEDVAALEGACFSTPWTVEMLREELFNPNASYIVAEDPEGEVLGYGIIYPQGQTSGNEMVETEIPIVWYDTAKKPSKNYTLILASASSRYGDYMNGCNTNVMYVDDFRWRYPARHL